MTDNENSGGQDFTEFYAMQARVNASPWGDEMIKVAAFRVSGFRTEYQDEAIALVIEAGKTWRDVCQMNS